LENVERAKKLTWLQVVFTKKKDCAVGNKRFFVGQWSAKALLSRQMQKQGLLHSLLQFDVSLLRMMVFNIRLAT
jgi:hypothetical protein